MQIYDSTAISPGIVYYAGYSAGSPLTIVHAKPEGVPPIDKLHLHTKDTEYYLVLRGSMEILINDKVIKVTKDKCLETFPNEKHKIVSYEENTEYIVIRTNLIPGDKVVLE